MADVYYVAVVWTGGDTITEAKLDNMVANDRAVDAMANGVELTERADPSTPGANKLHMYAKDKDGVPTLYVINDAGSIYELSESTPSYIFPLKGTLFTDTLIIQLPVIKNSIITRAFAYANTAPTGANLIFDMNKNGTSIWASTQANRLTITATNQTGSQTSFDTTALTQDDILSIDVDQTGSTIAGADAVVYLKTK